jgi:hypothetical protein
MLQLPGYAVDLRSYCEGQHVNGPLKDMWLHELSVLRLVPDGITHGRAAFRARVAKQVQHELRIRENDAIWLLQLFCKKFLPLHRTII